MRIKSRLTILMLTAILVWIYNFSAVPTFENTIDSELCSEIRLPIIMYHAFLNDEKTHGKFVISPAQFEEDIKYILENGYVPIGINDLIAYTSGEATPPEKPIMITIDDGYYNNYLYAFPILKKYNTKAVISPIMKYSELYSQHEENNAYYSHITWQQGREMIESNLIEFQNHTYDMHSTNERGGIKRKPGESLDEYQKILYSDLYKAHNMIKDDFGFVPKAIVYPFGYYGKDAEKVIQQIGYTVSLSCEEGINNISPGDSLYMLKRYNRPHGKNAKDFFKNILK